MEGRRILETIQLENILSYSSGTEPVALEPLNVLIGPNASGKSNFISALELLHAAPRDLQDAISSGGGTRDWLWKGTENPTATVDITVGYSSPQVGLRYRLSFSDVEGRFRLVDEVVESERPLSASDAQPYSYYRFGEGNPIINALVSDSQGDRRAQRPIRDGIKFDQSILSQRRDPDSYPELAYLARTFEYMSGYRRWDTAPQGALRSPQKTDLRQDVLRADGSNLGVILNDLMNRPTVKEQILERMRDFYPSFKYVNTHIVSGTVQIHFEEDRLLQSVPATRLSDGSLRFLALLSVLYNPNWSGVICIEEPELGLHPDIIPEVAKLLIETSRRCQLFVTTHSDILVDALSEVPETVMVCEKVDGATQLNRLDTDELKSWLDEYRLGEMWMRGAIGGTR